jgi:hypothetical protein
VDCARTGARPRTDGENGLAVVEAIEAAQLSRRLGRPVLLEEVRAVRPPRPRTLTARGPRPRTAAAPLSPAPHLARPLLAREAR